MPNNLLSNPIVVGVVTGSVTWYVLDELGIFKKLFKKSKNKKKVIRNRFGQVEIYETDVDDDDDEDEEKEIGERDFDSYLDPDVPEAARLAGYYD